MKFTEDNQLQGNLIHSYEPGQVQVGDEVFKTSLIISRDWLLSPWSIDQIEVLSSEHLEVLTQGKPDLLLLGTGQQHRWPDMALLCEIGAMGIGCEVMNSASACRTYNVVAGEGRKVTAAIIID